MTIVEQIREDFRRRDHKATCREIKLAAEEATLRRIRKDVAVSP